MTKKSSTPFYLLIAAAGSGTRLGGDIPKQYQKIAGKSILRHTIEKFLACPGLQEIRVIIDLAHEILYQESIEGLELPPPIVGGKERNQSIYNGLKGYSHLKNEDVILIHDAARPFIRTQEIEAIASEVAAHGAATLACPVSDTMKRGNGDYVDRNDLWAIQTPQAFPYGLIREAHEKADPAAQYTDDTALVVARGHKVKLIPGPRDNFKITTGDDMKLARTLMEESRMHETRTGTGFDVHKFENRAGNAHVHLCGIEIPHSCTLEGHSDADVGLHALTDAILGAIGAGDIGQHFPPSDPQWKGVDSAIFVEKALQLIRQRNATINNIDITLICEAPKVGPHRDDMRTRVAEICGLDETRVNIKATTTEGLGFTGRQEGIAAQATATISLRDT